METITFTPISNEFATTLSSIGITATPVSMVVEGKWEFNINDHECTVNFGSTYIGIFKGSGKIQISYTSKKNTKEIISSKFAKLFGGVQPLSSTITDSTPKSKIVGDSFLVPLPEYSWGMIKELKHLGCELDSAKQEFKCPASKQSNVSEVVNHYTGKSKGLTSSQRTKRDKLIPLISLDCEFKKDNKGLWVINNNDLETKKHLQEMCRKVGFKHVRTVNGVRHLLK